MTQKNSKPVKAAAPAAEDHLWLEALAGRSASGLEDASAREAELVGGILRAKGRELKPERHRRSEPAAAVATPKSRGGKSPASSRSGNIGFDDLSMNMKTNPLDKNSEQEIIGRVIRRLEDKGLI